MQTRFAYYSGESQMQMWSVYEKYYKMKSFFFCKWEFLIGSRNFFKKQNPTLSLLFIFQFIYYYYFFKFSVQVSSFYCIHRILRPSPLSSSRTFSSTPRETLYLLAATPLTPTLHESQQPLIYFLSQCICLFWTFHIYGIMQYVDSVTGVFTQHVFKVHPRCSMYQYFITFCGCVIFYRMATSPFLYASPVDRHLVCFYFWAITNNVAINIHVQVFVDTGFQFSQIYTQEQNCWVTEQIGV